MRKKIRRKKNEERKRRFEAIKDLMSTFTMGTIAVVAAVTLIPASPKAEIIKSTSLSKEIVYQVTVTDEDNALDLSTLYVALENQLEYYEQPITLGENAGYFDQLEHNTQYRLSVYGNKGFGKERLDTLLVKTNEKVGGTILSVKPETDGHNTRYLVDISIHDPDSKYGAINLYYGYKEEPDEPITYSVIPILEASATIEIGDIFTTDVIHMYLEGTTTNDPELLDEISITPPFKLEAYVDMHYRNSTEVGFSVYTYSDVTDIQYEMKIYEDGEFLRKERANIQSGAHESKSFVIANLTPNTIYRFECVAVFVNPQTLREERQIVSEQEITTLESYSYTYTKKRVGEFLEVTITLEDPNNVFQNANYITEDISSAHPIFLEGESYTLTLNGTEKSTSFSIFLPSISYEITIALHNTNDSSVKQKIDIITN